MCAPSMCVVPAPLTWCTLVLALPWRLCWSPGLVCLVGLSACLFSVCGRQILLVWRVGAHSCCCQYGRACRLFGLSVRRCWCITLLCLLPCFVGLPFGRFTGSCCIVCEGWIKAFIMWWGGVLNVALVAIDRLCVVCVVQCAWTVPWWSFCIVLLVQYWS